MFYTIRDKIFFSKFYYISLFAVAFVQSASAERLHQQIYSSIEGGAACFRRLNGTHQAGCSSSDKGAVGVVHMIKEMNDAEWVALNASAGPYIAVVSTSQFHDVVEVFMQHPGNIAGILLYDNVNASANFFSQESMCPNEYSSANGSQCSSVAGDNVWNKPGTGLLRRDIPFPIFFLPKTRAEEVEKIEMCYDRYNLDRENQKGQPLCSLQLNSFMFAAVNSEVCLRRSATTTFLTPTKVCDPLGDQNVYYSLFPRGKDTDDAKKTVTLVTARIDSASLFDGIAAGAASSVVGLVSLITAASVLSKMTPIEDSALYKHNILWTLFNGESFDYIGSQRVAFDMSRGAWPATPLPAAQVRLHVELGQLGGALRGSAGDGSWPFNAFAPYTREVPQAVTEFLAELLANLNVQNMSVTPKFTMNLPPSSLHSFRRILKNETESGELPELLLADHNDTFSNMFYESALDGPENVDFEYHNITIDSNGTFLDTAALIANGTMKDTDMQVKIARFATALSRTLYQQVVGSAYTGTVTASAHLVDEMLYCFLSSLSCRLLAAADYAEAAADEGPPRPPALYVSVVSWPGGPAYFAGNLLALLAGSQLPANQSACHARKDPNFSFYWLKGWNNTGVCVQTTMNFSQAVSPAFIIKDYDYSSGLYSTWTESVWQAMSARVFVVAGGGGARLAAVAGSLATLLAGFLTFWLQRHAQLLFRSAPTAASAVANEASSGILRAVNC